MSFRVLEYSPICRRVNRRAPNKKDLNSIQRKRSCDIPRLTLVKITNRGEWMRHKWKVRRGWIEENRVGIAVTDEKSMITKNLKI
ncbi:MAG: hypothetical protein H5T44_04100 [Thermoplasmatales archaeon]|nr:hypothetical protein [Thermoplasmatales archaeon]